MSKVFVGNFSFNIDNEKLKEYFTSIGEVVSAKVMTEGPGGRSRGFGFVEFTNAEDAKKAIEELDGKSWEGRSVKVSEDRSNRSFSGDQRKSRYSFASDRRDSGPMGYFRAQPLDLGMRRRKKKDIFKDKDSELQIDYKDPKLLQRFMSERGRIFPRRMTGLSSQNQRAMTKAVRRAQHLALIPYVNE